MEKYTKITKKQYEYNQPPHLFYSQHQSITSNVITGFEFKRNTKERITKQLLTTSQQWEEYEYTEIRESN